ncbi:Serine protease inhibitor [Actinacidiphila yanglinensis]|uniref:Serine protease inhibitor n=1 Tax=Actinacidiphila yanglinensis TaxID=310779 RepID=A0A1H5Y226_9ACTN|nr:serpin family protein [Actinacidiphila yanglinensis]SEG17650.1 Serine protease inhibitor [Actinacidiphila yanglinensis]
MAWRHGRDRRGDGRGAPGGPGPAVPPRPAFPPTVGVPPPVPHPAAPRSGGNRPYAPQAVDAATVDAVNALSARWASRFTAPEEGTAFGAVGLWPLLAFLAGAAREGAVRDELADAVGVGADEAPDRGRAVMTALDGQPGLSTALGVWTREQVRLHQQWVARLPPGTLGRLTGDPAADRAALDAWAARRTRGLIPAMPVVSGPAVMMVLASALTVRTRWQRAFTPSPLRAASGPWAGRTDLPGLTRSGPDLDEVRVAEAPGGPLTVYEVRGDNGIDVHLLLGAPDAVPGAVLDAGVRVLAGECATVPGSRLPAGRPGPGLTLGEIDAAEPLDRIRLDTAPFRIGAEHDLLGRPALFGLAAAATADERGHFPGATGFPLVIGQARQAVRAEFGAEGFEAAAVTALAMPPGGAPPASAYRARLLRADLTRPFGFLAVRRADRLVLTAGWVPVPAQV